MIPKDCKRLAEVDFPIAVVSKHSAREKSIRHGHPSTLHLWWARRPLAACRAMLMALLLPDPGDRLCPADFKQKARALLGRFPGKLGATDEELRKALLKFIGDFANWDLSSDAQYLKAARGLVKAAHPEETPLVVDPFAGGGSIPLEALRLGCEAFASDLNPVACLILKVMLEDIPRHGPELAEDLRRVGAEVKKAAEKELAEFYPPDPDGSRPIAYLWARTVRCESPNCGAEIPLVRSFWLCKKANRRRALRVAQASSLHATGRQDACATVEFEIFEPKSDADVPRGTVTRANATCPCCQTVLAAPRVRAQLAAQRGGADVTFGSHGKRIGGARMMAVVVLKGDVAGRQYRLPTDRDYAAVWQAKRRLDVVAARPMPDGLSVVPDEPSPAGGGSGAGRAFSQRIYGMETWGDLFTARQKLSLATLHRLIAQMPDDASRTLLALSLSKLSERNNAQCDWMVDVECPGHLFTTHAIPPSWDFAEGNIMSDSSGSFILAFENTADNARATTIPAINKGQVEIADACDSRLPADAAPIWFTDPPYYDAIPYSDLSDFFLVWLKRALPNQPILHDPFDPGNPLSPKLREAVQDEIKQVDGRPKDSVFFEETMARAFSEGRRVLNEEGVACVVFAHKTTEGWEALLTGMIRGGWVITGSWPVATERQSRMRARDSAALATSVHLVCRPRTEAEVGD